jgi:ribosome-associated toxin RatA of RatAB toxin-antitoxin module
MSQRDIRAFDYVNQPYDVVRDALMKDPKGVFHRATTLATDRSQDLIAALSIDLGGVHLTKEVTIDVGQPEEENRGAELSRVTRIPVEWHAAESAGLFPAMKARLAIYPLSFTETQVELDGTYEPPFGILGSAIDALVGQRVAEASVHRFVKAVVETLKKELG